MQALEEEERVSFQVAKEKKNGKLPRIINSNIFLREPKGNFSFFFLLFILSSVAFVAIAGFTIFKIIGWEEGELESLFSAFGDDRFPCFHSWPVAMSILRIYALEFFLAMVSFLAHRKN